MHPDSAILHQVAILNLSRDHSIPHMQFPAGGPLESEPLSLTLCEIFTSKIILDETLTFYGHVTSSDMWPCDIPGVSSYRCSIVSESVSPAVFEIFGPTHVNMGGSVV